MTAGQLCFLILHYLNARRSLPRESGQRLDCLLLEQPGARSHCPVQISLPLPSSAGTPVPISKELPYSCPAIGQGPLAPNEKPGSPSPEMKLSELKGWTGWLTRSMFSKAGGHLSRDTCFILISESFPGKQACPGRTKKAKAVGMRQGTLAGQSLQMGGAGCLCSFRAGLMLQKQTFHPETSTVT